MPPRALRIGPLAMALAFAAGGCDLVRGCEPYDPSAAKATFDGRVGTIEIRNATSNAVNVELYHPDGTGAVELTATAGAGSTEIAGGFGNDWGVRLGDQCVTTLGEAGAWTGDRFVIDWPDD